MKATRQKILREEKSGLAVALVGAGPAGFYVADGLFRSEVPVRVDVFERLPVPFGLVRYGVAPDHPEIKRVSRQFDRIASNSGFRFIGNVTVGRDVAIEELRDAYDAVVLACGTPESRSLNIPGEQLPSSYSATEFVGWYNGHPEYADFEPDVSSHSAVVIGNGNVALDVARILARPAREFSATDMPTRVQELLSHKQIKTVWIIGRRGPAQTSFSAKELEGLQSLASISCHVDPVELELDPVSHTELTTNRTRGAAFEVLKQMASEELNEQEDRTQVRFRFRSSPDEILGPDQVSAIRLHRNQLVGTAGHLRAASTGEIDTVSCGLIVHCVGYRGVPMPGVPFVDRSGVFDNLNGRICHRLYAAGWIQHGPSGLLGTTKKKCKEIVAAILADLSSHVSSRVSEPDRVIRTLHAKGIRLTNYQDWVGIESEERMRGKRLGKEREKFLTVAALLDAAGHS